MKAFFINFTRILETNAKLYWSVILGIVGCLVFYVAEIIHIQNLLAHLDSNDALLQRATLEPIAQRYQWIRVILIGLAVVWAVWEYFKTKKVLNLK